MTHTYLPASAYETALLAEQDRLMAELCAGLASRLETERTRGLRRALRVLGIEPCSCSECPGDGYCDPMCPRCPNQEERDE